MCVSVCVFRECSNEPFDGGNAHSQPSKQSLPTGTPCDSDEADLLVEELLLLVSSSAAMFSELYGLHPSGALAGVNFSSAPMSDLEEGVSTSPWPAFFAKACRLCISGKCYVGLCMLGRAPPKPLVPADQEAIVAEMCRCGWAPLKTLLHEEMRSRKGTKTETKTV